MDVSFHWEGVWAGDNDLKVTTSGAFWVLFFTVQLPVHAKRENLALHALPLRLLLNLPSPF